MDDGRRWQPGRHSQDRFRDQLLRGYLAQGDIRHTKPGRDDDERPGAAEQLPDTLSHHVDEDADVRHHFGGVIEKNAIHEEERIVGVVAGLAGTSNGVTKDLLEVGAVHNKAASA